MSQKDLEGLLEIKVDPSLSLKDILDFIKIGNYEWARFIITENFNLILSLHKHNEFVRILGVEREDCLLPDGDFRIEKNSQKMEFAYSWHEPEKIKNIRKAAENKLKNFLKSKGIEVE